MRQNSVAQSEQNNSDMNESFFSANMFNNLMNH
jgi:hypothetical protein